MKRRPNAPLDEADSQMFRDAMGEVRQLAPVPMPPERDRPAPYPHMFDSDEAAVRGELLNMDFDPAWLEVGEELSYLRDGYPPRVLRQLKRGQYSVQDDIDLHQMNAAAAQVTIIEFLAEASRLGIRCVRIIHGKGLHSDSRMPTIKNLVDRVLRQRADVLAFHSAPAAQGGNGAVLVLLRPR